jgi:hypothetical protein
MTDALIDRIKAHRSAPTVDDPPTFDQMADRIEELERDIKQLKRERDTEAGWVVTIRDEPKVIWVNEWPNGACYSYQSEEFAKALSVTGSGAVRSAVKYVEAKE